VVVALRFGQIHFENQSGMLAPDREYRCLSGLVLMIPGNLQNPCWGRLIILNWWLVTGWMKAKHLPPEVEWYARE
jgi:hypothetical protein